MNNSNISMPDFVEMVKGNFKIADIKTIFEIGALDAKDSIFFKSEFPDADVYAFEGLPENYHKHLMNLVSIHCYNCVVLDFDGQVDFHKKRINGIHSVFDRGQRYGSEILRLDCYRIDTICKALGIDRIDMLKIDVEGATLEVLEGAGHILENIGIMHIETEDYQFFKGQKLDREVCEFLLSKNFRLIRKAGCEIQSMKHQYDSVWVNNSR